jgi:hypothetical protein
MAGKQRPIVKFNNTEELEAYKSAVQDFVFETEEPLGYVGLIIGEQGLGKTHLACTSATESSPTYLMDTELRAQIVASKFPHVKRRKTHTFMEAVIFMRAVKARFPKGTFVWDSGSDIQQFAEMQYLDETKAEKVYPIFNWAEVWSKCDKLIDEAKSDGWNLIATARMKDEYVNEKSTGKKKPRIYEGLKYKCDFAIIIASDGTRRVVKNGWDRDYLPTMPKTATVADIIKALNPATRPATAPQSTNNSTEWLS